MAEVGDFDSVGNAAPIPDADGNKFALIVGVNNSKASSYLGDLESAEQDALQVCTALQQPACGFKSVKLLTSGQAETGDVLDEILEFPERKTKADLLLFYFIGHGQPVRTRDGERDI